MIECGSCGTDALVLDRSGGSDVDDDLVVLCAGCAPGEITAALEAGLFEVPAERSAPSTMLKRAHVRAA